MITQTKLNFPDAEIKTLCQKYKVRELALFGSALRDDFNSSSDVDLLVEFDPEAKVGFIAFSKMQRELSTLLHRQVDLVSKAGLKPKLRQSILPTTRVIYVA
jgi:predicted nucleotidyltransferase